ncbi:MAG: EAL domain-containing protein [Actinomycetota bacterium]|nr:EAL domain-containing protein [Actinomycetota bacterium]
MRAETMEAPRPIRVLIADDEPVVRDALAELVGTEDSLELVGVAGDAKSAIALARETQPDVAMVDVRMPGGGGPHAAREIRIHCPHTRVVALSAYEDRGTVLEMVKAGATGYLVKGSAPGEILSSIHSSARGPISERVAADVLAELRTELAPEERQGDALQRTAQQVRGLLEEGALEIVYQPIIDLAAHRVVGVEALSRFQVVPHQPPDVWFAKAESVGLRADLELLALRRALDRTDLLPPGAYVSLNVSPETVMDRRFAESLAGIERGRLVVEITEHAQVDDYDALEEALRELRSVGVRLAVDDAGAGFASLRHILRLAPDVIKLDISLTRDIHTDQARRALASALISFASEIGYTIIAEGIEVNAELQVLRELGVGFGQGYYLSRPQSLPLGEFRMPAPGAPTRL